MKEYEKLANNLINHSCRLKKGEKVLIEYSNTDTQFIAVLIKKIFKIGAIPFVINYNSEISKILNTNITENIAKLKTKYMLPVMKDMDAYISIAGQDNLYDSSDIPIDKINIISKFYSTPVHIQERVNNTKWVILRWPTPSFAQVAEISTEKFRDMFFKVCTLNYAKMDKAMDNLKKTLQMTNKVKIISPNTNITFSIKNIPVIKCSGLCNIPDGEIYTAPIKNSVNGKIQYNIPSLLNGIKFENITFVVKNGKIIKATAGNHTKELNEILNIDEGSRYFGEFALGVNPYLTKPVLSILFDEKMTGSIHLTPGACYDDASNGNVSSNHWDLVLCQLKEYGGGEIYFDDKLIRKNGIFVQEEHLALNPENLK